MSSGFPTRTDYALPEGVRSRMLSDVNGLHMHILEAGFEDPHRPCVLLLHGFPELSYSWRRIMAPLAAAGYYVVAPDQRGYGRTTGWNAEYDTDLAAFSLPNLVQDSLCLVAALRRSSVLAVVGHDYGSPLAAWCALIRPDIFRSLVMMSAPFAGAPSSASASRELSDRLDVALANLNPPRRHYQRYFSDPRANADLLNAPQGVRDFLRAYFHYKSADWSGNRPIPLVSGSAETFALLPEYYVMVRDKTMPQTVAEVMPDLESVAGCRWLTEAQLDVFAAEFQRTGFQGGLNWYRCATAGVGHAELARFAGRFIEVPALFIAGLQDWGVRQSPGALERMQSQACPRLQGVHLVEGAGHWVQQEQADVVVDLLLGFLSTTCKLITPPPRIGT